MNWRSDRGQATVEAAVVLPVLFILIFLMAQPAIWLYTEMIMRGAAAEGCRVIVTTTAGPGDNLERDYIMRRLQGVPPNEFFSAEPFDITWTGSENASWVSVTIEVKQKPLPLWGLVVGAAGGLDSEGLMTRSVTASAPGKPDGLDNSVSISSWTTFWDDEWNLPPSVEGGGGGW